MQNSFFSQKFSKFSLSLLLAATLAILAGCGAGGAGTSAASGVGATSSVAATITQTITGTAATGAAIPKGSLITIKDSTGKTVSVKTADNTGSFSIPVTGMTPPFMLQAGMPTPLPNMYSAFVPPSSFMSTTSSQNVNITPVTTLIMYELNNGSDPGTMWRNNTFTSLTSTAIGTAETTVRNGLASKLASLQTYQANAQASAVMAVPTSTSMMYDTFTVGSSTYDTALDNIGNITAYPSGGATLIPTSNAPAAASGVPINYTTAAASTTISTAASVQLLLSSPQMNSSGVTPVTMTAVVLDNKNQTMVGRAVTFSVTCTSTSTYTCPSTSGAETAYISNISGVSGTNGQVTAQLNLGTNKSNRMLTISANVDSQTTSGSVSVTGTTISINGNTSLALGASSTLTITVKDSSGTIVPDTTLAISSQNGNAIVLSPTTGITNSAGQITATVTAANAGSGTDTLTVSGAGVSQTQTLTINSSSFAFNTPAIGTVAITLANPAVVTATGHGLAAGTPIFFTTTGALPTGIVAGQTYYVLSSGLTANTFTFSATAGGAAVATSGTQSGVHTLQAVTPEILVNTATPISVLWTVGGVAQSNQSVNFYTSRGTITGSSSTTNASGIATASVSASSTGATILTASGPGGTPAAIYNVVFYTSSANAISAQANPSTVSVNTVGSSTNQSAISVIVRDANQNLVQNATVVFNQVADPSGGSLATNSATTDITGTASINYIAGTVTAPQNSVQITATVASVAGVPTIAPQPTATVLLTVAAQDLFVTLGTDSAISSDLPVIGTYAKNYFALVTDSAGNPAPDGTPVTFVIRPVPSTWSGSSGWWGFQKGFYVWDTSFTPNQWTRKAVTITSCPSEDQNDTGVYSAALDLNGNGALDPDGVATVNKTAKTTSGFATATITYTKKYASWVQIVLEATAGTVGNSPPATTTFILPFPAADDQQDNYTPAWVRSPYGLGAKIGDTLPDGSTETVNNNSCGNTN